MWAKPDGRHINTKRGMHSIGNINSHKNKQKCKNRIRTKIANDSRKRNR